MDMGTSNVDNNRLTLTASEYYWLDPSVNSALDIAIYKTSTDIIFNGLIQAIRLPSRRQRNEEFIGWPAEIMGWGNVVADNRILFYGNFRILANRACLNQVQSFYEMCIVPENNMNLAAQSG
jgi:Trypsin